MRYDVPKLPDSTMIQWAKDYLTKRNVQIVDRDYQETFWDITVYHDPQFDFWHQVRFIDKADKTLGWIVEVCYVQGEWKLAARCLPYAIT